MHACVCVRASMCAYIIRMYVCKQRVCLYIMTRFTRVLELKHLEGLQFYVGKIKALEVPDFVTQSLKAFAN